VIGPDEIDEDNCPDAEELALPETAGASACGALGLAPKIAAKPAVSMESRSAELYDAKPQRSFADDYSPGAQSNAARGPSHDIDGRPLTARHVLGRTEAGAGDVALPREEYDEIATAGTGGPILEVSQSELGRDVGSVSVNGFTCQPAMACVSKELSPAQIEKVARVRELGRVSDQVAGEIPVIGQRRALTAPQPASERRTRNPVEPKHWATKTTTSRASSWPKPYARHAITASPAAACR